MDDTADVGTELEAVDLVELESTVGADDTADVVRELGTEDTWELDNALDFVLKTDVIMVDFELDS